MKSLDKSQENIFLNASTSAYWKDLEGRYLQINQAFLREYYGHTENDILGQRDIDLWDGKAPLFHENDQRVMQIERKGIFIEDIFYQEEKKFFMSFKMPYYSRDGKLIGICGASLLLNNKSTPQEFPYELIEFIQLFATKHFSPKNCSNLSISKRQKECLFLLSQGMTQKQIAATINLSPKTIEHHLDAVKNKLGCSNRFQLLKKAYELGII